MRQVSLVDHLKTSLAKIANPKNKQLNHPSHGE
jgi:hypothetical protein